LIDPARGSIGDTRLPPTLIVNGWHVATVQFSRAVREGVRVDGAWMPRRAAPVSQNSTACDALELPGMGSWHAQVWSTVQADQA
jgi:hypothetical protein